MSPEERNNIWQQGVPLGRVGFPPRSGAALEVRAHLVLVIMVVLELLVSSTSSPKARLAQPFLTWLISMAALLLSLLLHELAHVLAARRAGGGAERIVLWPLGGLAPPEVPDDPMAHLRVAAAGPLMSVGLLAGSSLVCLGCGWELLPGRKLAERLDVLEAASQHVVLWNLFLVVVNAIPCLVSDGGRALHAILWARLESLGQAALVILRVSQVAAVFCLVTALILFVTSFGREAYRLEHPFWAQLSLGLLLLALGHFVESRLLQMRLAHGDEREGIFGYDFSRGYTSLERTATRPDDRRASLLGRLRKGFRRRARARRLDEERQVQERVDDLLRKIHDEGMASLTAEERRFLEDASRRMRG
ncbi:MAG: hypothetical protein HY721_00760 [Planctomycetes bacterium]|nr:hypothetical protein [Planctomycetota bacterium]